MKAKAKPDLVEKLEQELHQLGKLTQPQIVRRLVRAGVHGDTENIEDCPLAVYLRKRLHVRRISVGLCEVHMIPRRGVKGSAKLPRALARFVAQVDHLKYPQLWNVTAVLKHL